LNPPPKPPPNPPPKPPHNLKAYYFLPIEKEFPFGRGIDLTPPWATWNKKFTLSQDIFPILGKPSRQDIFEIKRLENQAEEKYNTKFHFLEHQADYYGILYFPQDYLCLRKGRPLGDVPQNSTLNNKTQYNKNC
jgi:hypothetical protein